MKAACALSTLMTLLTVGCGSAMDAQQDVDLATTKQNAPITCAIQTVNGRYLTAVGGGGRVSDVLHTDATGINAWEKFVLEDPGFGSPIRYGIKTKTGHYLTAVGGGGRITDVIHSNATQHQAWENFTLVSLGNNWYAIQTNTGHYLTATGGGGNVNDAIHSDATQVQAWEKFKFICGL